MRSSFRVAKPKRKRLPSKRANASKSVKAISLVILRFFDLPAVGVLAGEFPAQTVGTAPVVAAKLFIGIQAVRR